MGLTLGWDVDQSENLLADERLLWLGWASDKVFNLLFCYLDYTGHEHWEWRIIEMGLAFLSMEESMSGQQQTEALEASS